MKLAKAKREMETMLTLSSVWVKVRKLILYCSLYVIQQSCARIVSWSCDFSVSSFGCSVILLFLAHTFSLFACVSIYCNIMHAVSFVCCLAKFLAKLSFRFVKSMWKVCMSVWTFSTNRSVCKWIIQHKNSLKSCFHYFFCQTNMSILLQQQNSNQNLSLQLLFFVRVFISWFSLVLSPLCTLLC